MRVLAACETMGGATAICSDKVAFLSDSSLQSYFPPIVVLASEKSCQNVGAKGATAICSDEVALSSDAFCATKPGIRSRERQYHIV